MLQTTPVIGQHQAACATPPSIAGVCVPPADISVSANVEQSTPGRAAAGRTIYKPRRASPAVAAGGGGGGGGGPDVIRAVSAPGSHPNHTVRPTRRRGTCSMSPVAAQMWAVRNGNKRLLVLPCRSRRKVVSEVWLDQVRLMPDDWPSSSAVSRQPSSAVSRQPSAVSRQPSAVSRQPSVVSRQPSAVSRLPSAVSRQPSDVSRQSSAVSRQPSASAVSVSVSRQSTVVSC